MTRCKVCREIIIPDLEAQGIHKDSFIHVRCYVGAIIWEGCKLFLKILGLVILAAIYVAMCTKANAQETDEKDDPKNWVKGGVVIGITNDGKCLFKPFIKVGDTENDPDTDKPQILGFSPGNVYIDRHGRMVWERVLEEVFIPLGRFKTIHGRMCKCPPYQE